MAENPPAFPRTGEGFGNPRYDEPGMTLRDWFAGQALASFGLVHSLDIGQMPAAAANAYKIADAMLAERSKSETGNG